MNKPVNLFSGIWNLFQDRKKGEAAGKSDDQHYR
jgi:hypothetical protein